ncbi:MAG: hypothetical protein R3B96_15910 [Pirellulaceae bacterium]
MSHASYDRADRLKHGISDAARPPQRRSRVVRVCVTTWRRRLG